MSKEQNWRRKIINRNCQRREFLKGAINAALVSVVGIQGVGTVTASEGDLIWKYGTGNRVISSPTVVDGTVFVGSHSNKLYAIDASSGEERWTIETGGGIFSSPTVVDNTVFVGGFDRSLRALDASSGEEQWSFQTRGPIYSSPTISDETVFIGSEDGVVYAVNASTGKEEWRFPTNHPVESSPSVVDGTVYIGSNDHHLYALSANDGEELWKFETDHHVRGSPTVVDGTVFVGSEGENLYALDSESGEKQWVYQTEGKIDSSPTVVNGTVYIGLLGSFEADYADGGLYAVNATTGTQEWAYEIGDTVVFSSPTVADGSVFVGGNDGYIYAVSASSGELRWKYETGDSIWSSPTIASGTLYIGSDDGNIYAIDAGVSGASVGSRTTLGTLGHHGEWRYADQVISTGSTLQNAENRGIESILAGGLGTIAIGGGYIYYKKYRSSNELQKQADSNSSNQKASTESTTASSSSSAVPSSNIENLSGVSGFKESQTKPSQHGSETKFESNELIPQNITSPVDKSLSYESINKKESIGSGGNADVYLAAVSNTDNFELAIKEPRVQDTVSSNIIDKMTEEARTWQELDDHDNIVSVIDFGSNPLPWIALEYMDGGDLAERSNNLSYQQAIWTAFSTTEAVRYAHNHGVAHLDLKPANILFKSVEDAWDVPKVADWGLSKELLKHSKSVDGMSPQYAAPEQIDPETYGKTDNITDIYQLGAVFYELFTGRPPFTGKPFEVIEKIRNEKPTPPSEIADIPKEMDSILLKSLATQKSERYEDILYLRDEFVSLYKNNYE